MTGSPDAKFFEPYKLSKKDINFYYKKLKCPESADMQIWGDYNSDKAQQLVI